MRRNFEAAKARADKTLLLQGGRGARGKVRWVTRVDGRLKGPIDLRFIIGRSIHIHAHGRMAAGGRDGAADAGHGAAAGRPPRGGRDGVHRCVQCTLADRSCV